MKRKELIRHLTHNHCVLVREGGRHSIYYNPINSTTSSVPRHSEIHDFLAKKICKDLGLELP